MEANEKVDSVDTQPAGGGEEKKQDEPVSYEAYKRLVAQRKADQEKFKALSEKVSLYEQKEKDLEEKKLMEQGEYKKMLQEREKEIRQLRDEREKYKNSLVKTAKLQAFQEALGGKLADPTYYSFVDTERIAIDPESGTVDTDSLKSYVNEFVSKHQRLIEFSSAKLPNSAPSGSKALSYEEWLKLPLKEKKARLGDVVDKK